MQRRTRRSRWLAAITVVGVVTAASCGGDDDDGAGDTTEAPAGTEAVSAGTEPPTETEAPSTDAPSTDAPSTEGTEPGDTEGTEPTDTEGTEPTDTEGTEPSETGGSEPASDGAEMPEFVPGPGEHHLEEDEGEPVQGGTLVYGLEADTANAWAHYRASYATSGYVALTAVSDTLFSYTDEGELVPMLVESYEPNEDYTEWTLTIREGILNTLTYLQSNPWLLESRA